MTRLKGKTALVTGGTSGIGQAIAAALAGKSALLVVGRKALELEPKNMHHFNEPWINSLMNLSTPNSAIV